MEKPHLCRVRIQELIIDSKVLDLYNVNEGPRTESYAVDMLNCAFVGAEPHHLSDPRK